MESFKSLVFKILKMVNGFPFRLLYSGDVQILMFHRIVSDLGDNRIINDGIEVTEGYLEYLIKFYLEQNYIAISMDQFSKLPKEKSRKKYVVYSFDDGYLDNLEKALPVFEKYKIPFNVYIPTDFITNKQFAWWYFLEDLLKEEEEIFYKINDVEKTIECYEYKDTISAFILLRSLIQEDPEVLECLITRYPINLSKYYDLFLNLNQLKLLSSNPLVTIGSHSLSHLSLAKSDDITSYNEVYKSKKELEAMIQKEVKHFSFPFGTKSDVSIRDISYVKGAGYLTALTTNYGDVHLNQGFDFFAIPRIWTSELNKRDELLRSVYGINSYVMR